MNCNYIILRKGLILVLSLFALHPIIKAQDVALTICIRGIYESKISLFSLSSNNLLQPQFVLEDVKNGEKSVFKIPKESLPGEFVLRFDYKESPASIPYPSEKRIFVYDQNLELWVSPKFCNNADSTWFQSDERENTVYSKFIMEVARKKTMIGLLQNFLLNYDDPKSSFYKKGIEEYESRRKLTNDWIDNQINQNKTLFVSSQFGFQKIPYIEWNGSDEHRKLSLRNNYFNEMSFNNPFILKTSSMKEWMDGYVNLFGEYATSIQLRDSLFTVAGKIAIEKVRKGNPYVYGWMVDYFYNGYESYNIEKGIKMLEPYINDSTCFTNKRIAINKRLKGIETLRVGTIAPNIVMSNYDDNLFELYGYQTDKKKILLLFWSASCCHCIETIEKLSSLYTQSDIEKKLEVIAISLDETDSEVQAWELKKNNLKGWIHLHAKEGINSKVANDYYILSTPVMILIDSNSKEIVAFPDKVEQIEAID